MRRQLEVKKPFQNVEERICILVVLLTIFGLPFLTSFLNISREMLIRNNIESEADGAFLSQQIYHETKPIDILMVGPCTVWWQLYTPQIKGALDKKLHRETNVITLGFNHFGSDLIYLILKDITQRRKVTNLVLALPKIEDLHPFPHKNANFWWRYPQDIDFNGLSVLGHIKLFGVSVFSAVPRIFLSLRDTGGIEKQVFRQSLGFNVVRSGAKISSMDLEAIEKSVEPKVLPLKALLLRSHPEFSEDWVLFYKEIAHLAQGQNIKVTFVDSPHRVEFEENSETIPAGFEEFYPKSSAVTLDFKSWQKSLPKKYQEQIVAGSNLTVIGAQLFTNTIVDSLIEETRHE